jgi:sarcosine oxidase subunit beta
MNEQAIPQRVDAVVIGSGALGASTAFHLASSGLSVALLDKAELALKFEASRFAAIRRHHKSVAPERGAEAPRQLDLFSEHPPF